MKALIYCQEERAGKLMRYLSHPHAYLLPFLNKSLISHWLESLYLMGFREVRLVSRRSWVLEQALGDGQTLGLKLSFQSGQEHDDLSTVLKKNQGFAAGEPVLCLQGYGLLLPPANPVCLNLPADKPLALHPAAAAIELYWLPAAAANVQSAQQAPLSQPLSIQALPDLQTYYLAQLGLLRSDLPLLNLPAYGTVQGVRAGAGLQMHASARASGATLLGHRCQLGAMTRVADSVLGEDVIVEAGSTLEHCVVLSGSWVGPGLNLRHKLIAGTRLIDPFNNETLDFEGADFLADLRSKKVQTPFWQRFLAGVFMLLPLFSQRRMLWWQVLCGRRRLIEPATVDPQGASQDVITYADALGHTDPIQRQFDNICYQQQRSVRMELLICWLWLKQQFVAGSSKKRGLSVSSPTAVLASAYSEAQSGAESSPVHAVLSSGIG